MFQRTFRLLNNAWHWFDTGSEHYTKDDIRYAVSVHRDNVTTCSCAGCRNERRNNFNSGKSKLTMQERKELERYDYDIKEIE